MDNELVIKIGDKVVRLKLKSQAIILLEKIYGKNIFEIFRDLSVTTLADVFYVSLVNKEELTDVKKKEDLMDLLLEQYSLIELGDDILNQLAVKSGILKQSDLEENDTPQSLEEIKNV